MAQVSWSNWGIPIISGGINGVLLSVGELVGFVSLAWGVKVLDQYHLMGPSKWVKLEEEFRDTYC